MELTLEGIIIRKSKFYYTKFRFFLVLNKKRIFTITALNDSAKKKENEFCFIFTGQATFFSFSKRGRFELKRGGVGNT